MTGVNSSTHTPSSVLVPPLSGVLKFAFSAASACIITMRKSVKIPIQ
jgi:hypothetical protein